MKKGYYIHFEGRQSIGVSKKIDMQIDELKKYFQLEELEVNNINRSFLQRLIGLLPFASISRNYENVLDKINSPDFLYVRRTVADKEYVCFWKRIKEKYPKCKIIVEIYTYPYDKDDFGKWNAWPFWFKELIYRPQLKKYIDRFVTYTKDEEIFGVSTICTTNGIDCNSVRAVKGIYQDRELHMIGVAYMQRQHGYERVIKGLAHYYKQHNREYTIYLDLVGDGPEKKKYQKLVKENRLEKYVTFFPTTSGEELEKLYDCADIALAAFGMYKVNYYEAIGAIKTRECLAKGLPMISGSPIDILNSDFDYAKIFSNDRTPIDMECVLDFFQNIKEKGRSKENVAVILREYAKEHASMKTVMAPVVEYIETERG